MNEYANEHVSSHLWSKLIAFEAVLVELVDQYPAADTKVHDPETVKGIIKSMRELGSRNSMREVALAQSQAPRTLVAAAEILIFD